MSGTKQINDGSFTTMTVSGPLTLNANTSINYQGQLVVQLNTPTDSVEVNSHTGLIVCESGVAALSDATFTVNNDKVTTNHIVLVSLNSYSGAGVPIVQCVDVDNGSFDIQVYNAHATNATNGNPVIAFMIVDINHS